MKSRLVPTLPLLLATCVASGDIIIDLRPASAGPFTPGEVVNVEVYLMDGDMGHPITGEPIWFRGLQIDFTDTEPSLGLPVEMELETGELGFLLALFPELPMPAVICVDCMGPVSWAPTLPPGGEMLFGNVDVTVNASGWLDVLNADEPNDNYGAWANFGLGMDEYDPVTRWRAYTGEITGGRLWMDVVPEPGLLTLFALGSLLAMRRRRCG